MTDRQQFSLIWLAVLSMVAMVVADTLTYKLFTLFGLVLSVSLVVFPITYCISDVVVEVYGQRVAMMLMAATLVGDLLFDGSLSFSSLYSSAANTQAFSHAYYTVLHPLWRVFTGNIIALIAGFVINISLMDKLRRHAHFKSFIARSIFSTFCGELVFTSIGYCIWFYHKRSDLQIAFMIAGSMGFKVVFASVMALPASAIARWVASGELSIQRPD